MLLRYIVQKYIAVLVQNLAVKDRLCIDTAVGDSRISTCQFKVRYTIGDTAKTQRCVSIPVFVHGCNAKILKIFNTKLRCDIFNQPLGSNNVHGVSNGFTDGCRSLIGVGIGVERLVAVRSCIRFIFLGRCQ